MDVYFEFSFKNRLHRSSIHGRAEGHHKWGEGERETIKKLPTEKIEREKPCEFDFFFAYQYF